MKHKIFPCVIGLGYVGLPVFIRLMKRYQTTGFDTNKKRIDLLKKRKDFNYEFNAKDLSLYHNSKLTNKPQELKKCNFYIITVPTPLKKNLTPDLKFLENAYLYVSNFLEKDDIVIVESTVYPGATRDLAKKIFEKKTRLRINKDFFIGYSPERINPGDKKHRIENTKKILAFETKNKLIRDKILKVYRLITKKLVICNSLENAETAKVIENIQRDLNIALMNDIFIFSKKMNLNFEEIIKLASSKWNFLKFNAGLVGGHCLPVDPYYLSFIAKKNNISLDTVLAGRNVNQKLKDFIYNQIKKKISYLNRNIKVLISGITYKKDVSDLRNSYPLEIYLKLKKNFKSIHAFDKHCNEYDRKKFKILNKLKSNLNYSLVIFLVNHKNHNNLFNLVKKKKISFYDPFKFYSK